MSRELWRATRTCHGKQKYNWNGVLLVLLMLLLKILCQFSTTVAVVATLLHYLMVLLARFNLLCRKDKVIKERGLKLLISSQECRERFNIKVGWGNYYHPKVGIVFPLNSLLIEYQNRERELHL